ncbi:MAG: hypothetical protein O3C41_07755 [Bacteroidetes bacterium]|nr:hypothetical protein [Bacteroidota bacterium]MDA1176960.1 hypothetical protein [Bacteroidota bacterium]
MGPNSLKYIVFLTGSGILIYDDISTESMGLLSLIGLILLVVGIYLISKGIREKPKVDPYAVQSYDEEE